MDQYQSRGKHLTNFLGHWYMQIFPENEAQRDWSILDIHMDQWLPNLPESSGLHRYWSIECSSLLIQNFDEVKPA